MPAFAEDSAAYLADFGEEAGWTPSGGGATVSGLMILDRPDEVLDGEAISRQYQATYATASWPGLKRGEQLTIGGAAYRLRTDPRQLDDGLFSAVALTKV